MKSENKKTRKGRKNIENDPKCLQKCLRRSTTCTETHTPTPRRTGTATHNHHYLHSTMCHRRRGGARPPFVYYLRLHFDSVQSGRDEAPVHPNRVLYFIFTIFFSLWFMCVCVRGALYHSLYYYPVNEIRSSRATYTRSELNAT